MRAGCCLSAQWASWCVRIGCFAQGGLLRSIFFLLAVMSIDAGLSTPAHAQSVCPTGWNWQVNQYGVGTDPYGFTPNGGTVEWPVESGNDFLSVDVIFPDLDASTTTLVSSTPSAVSPHVAAWVTAILRTTGSAVLTAEFENLACDPITLNVTVEVSIAPTVGDTTTTVDADSSNNPVTLDIDGYEIQSIAIASGPSNGTATVSASGTEINYTPGAGFTGTDSFTYTATNAGGTSGPAVATINVESAVRHTVSWSFSGPGAIGPVTFTDAIRTPISSPVEAAEGRRVAFWSPIPDAGATHREPEGCGIQPVGLAWYTDPITADCAVSIVFEEITFSPNALPEATVGAPYDQPITASGGFLDFTYSLAGGALPEGLELNDNGLVVGTPTEAGEFTVTISAENEHGHSNSQSYTLTVDVPEIVLGPVSLPQGTAGTDYGPVTFNADGGTEPYSFTLTGDLPEGLSFADGTLSGTPAEGGSFDFTVTVADANGVTAEREYTLAVAGAAIHTVAFSASGVSSAIARAFANGLELTNGQSVPSGTEVEFRWETPGASYTTLHEIDNTCGATHQNQNVWTATITADCTVAFGIDIIALNPAPHTIFSGTVGQPFNQQFTATGMGEVVWRVDADLPRGLSLDTATGVIAGTLEEAQDRGVPITAENITHGGSAHTTYFFEIEPAPEITIGPDTLPDGMDGKTYTAVNLTARGGEAPYRFAITTGALPDGLELSQTGTLSGTPIEKGSFTFTVTATDADDLTGEHEYTLTIDPSDQFDFVMKPEVLPHGRVGQMYREIIVADVGEPVDRFEIVDGELPEGMNNAFTPGSNFTSLEGTPTEAGTFEFRLWARASSGREIEQDYALVIETTEITIGPDALPDGVAGAAYGPATFTADGGTEPYSFTLAGDLPEGLVFENGTLSGLPVENGSFTFTVTATDANDFTGERDYTLTIDAPEIVVAIPDLPDGKVNTDYGPVSLSASGGTEPYAFDLVSGTLPEGMTLTADGTLWGTPTQDGEFAATVRATDAYGFEGTADAALEVEAPNLPVARNHTLEVMAGTSGSLDLTQGATGGPFTGAAIAVHPESEAGEARIAREDGTHLLHFAAAGTFAGTASLTYTLSNAEGTSAPATVTFTVIARPDPSLDPEVIGLVRAQTETAKRFANTQISNFNQRLEQLHNEGERRSNSIGVNMSVRQPTNRADAYRQEDDMPRDPALDAIDRTAPINAHDGNPQPAPVENPFGDLAFWSGGFVNFGTNDNGAINLDRTLVGISAGMDYRFSPELTAGFGIGYGRDVTEVGSNGTESRAEAFSLAAYGSYRPVPGLFIDGLAGYSTMSFDSRRFVTATGDFATGSRSGDQLFASATVGYEYRNEGLLVSPYGRLSGSHSTLDMFSETGAGLWNLTYGEQTIDTLSGTLGLRLQYAIPMDWGTLTPRGRLEYTHDFAGSSRASLGYADIGTLPYEFDIEGFSRDHLTVGLGLDAQIGESWKLGFDYRTALGTNGDSRDHTFGVSLGVQF